MKPPCGLRRPIALPQESVDLRTGEEVELKIKGRHDPCIVPRAVPVIEAAAALALCGAGAIRAFLKRERGERHMTELEGYRRQIDAIDAQLVELFLAPDGGDRRGGTV